MLRKISLWLSLGFAGGMFTTAVASAQAPPFVPMPSAPATGILADLPRPPDAPASLMKPGPVTQYGCAAQPEPYFVNDPRLDPPAAQPGWVVDADVDAVVPHIFGVQMGFVGVGARAPDVVSLPAAGFDWAVAPRLQLGYRFPSGFGEFAVSYRGLTTNGEGTTAGLDGPADLRSQLDFHQIDVDYLTREFSLANWGMVWHIGTRLTSLYYDSRADEPTDLAAAGSTIFEQRFTNSFWGIGPHAGVELSRCLADTGLSFMARIDAATLLGRMRQGFFEESTTLGPGETRFSGGMDVPTVNAQAGLGWQPSEDPNTKFFVGYTYEYWWDMGNLSAPGTSANMRVQGFFLRMALNF